MQDPPSSAELVGAVREFLETEGLPACSGRLAFLMRVAVNSLGIVERELKLGADTDAAERDRLRALLGTDGTTEELNRELCARIRAGTLGADDAALLAHLRATTLGKLEIDQPKYSGIRAAREAG